MEKQLYNDGKEISKEDAHALVDKSKITKGKPQPIKPKKEKKKNAE